MKRSGTNGIGALAIACGVVFAPAWVLADSPAHAGHSHPHNDAHAGHDHDGHHLCEKDIQMPKDFASAVARIKACRKTIGEEVAEGHFEEVHAPLDEASIILGKLMPIARDSGVPKSRWREVNIAATDLRKQLGNLHTALDKNAKIDFKTASVPIDQAIKRLETVARTTTSTAAR